MSAGHGVSRKCYGREKEKLAGIGRGNKFLGNICQDVSCLITRLIEKENLGVLLKDKKTKETS